VVLAPGFRGTELHTARLRLSCAPTSVFASSNTALAHRALSAAPLSKLQNIAYAGAHMPEEDDGYESRAN